MCAKPDTALEGRGGEFQRRETVGSTARLYDWRKRVRERPALQAKY
jgi:hypothetical protein